MQLIPINTTIGGYDATGLEVRVIMDNLYAQSPVQVYYSYYTDEGALGSEGNITLVTTLSSQSITNLQNALQEAVAATPVAAILRMWQWGGSLYKFAYRLEGREAGSVELSGNFIAEGDATAIKAEVLTTLGIEEVIEQNSVWGAAFAAVFG